MRISARLLRYIALSSAARGAHRSRSNSSKASSRRVLFYARTTGSQKMSGEPESLESSNDSASRRVTTAAPAAAVTSGVGNGNNSQGRDGEWFRVSDSVELVLHRGTITKWFVDGKTDAIVNAANERMLGGGGVDGAIHRGAGPKLRQACWEVPEVRPGVRCPFGEARITPAFNLSVLKVIHTVGPIYNENENPAVLLGNAYRNSLKLAVENGIKYICFPAISCGVYRYPVAEAAAISLSVIKEASDGLSEVHFMMFEKETYVAWIKEAQKKFAKI